MQHTRQIAVIGAGAMGGAFIAGLLARELVQATHLIATDVRPERRAELAAQHGIVTTDDNRAAVQAADLIILAIKPQLVPSVLPPLRGLLKPDAVCLSIIAGTRLQTLHDLLEHAPFVRCMPNTPATVGAGMSVWTCAPTVTPEQRDLTQQVLQALGKEAYVENEYYLDMATAVSGSGPAYVFLVLEALIDAGVQIGLPRPLAEQLAQQTLYGAVVYAQTSGQHPALLRNAVTSPGGTTAAGLYALEQGAVRAAFAACVQAAYQRSQELGNQS